MCIWKVEESERKCVYCSYRGGCEEYAKVTLVDEAGAIYVGILSALVGRDIMQHSRERELVWARNMACYRLVMDGYSLCKVGRFMGMDHSTVSHAKKQVANMLDMPSMYPEEMSLWEKFTGLISS